MTTQESNVSVEIPLVFSSLEANPRRFVVNDASRTIRECPQSDSPQNDSSLPQNDNYYFDDDQARQRGAASVSTLVGGASRDQILTTSLLPDNPAILSVALLSPNNDESPPVLVQLDIGSETRQLGTIVKTRAFYCHDSTTIALILVDSNAVVWRLQLDSNTLCPVVNMDMWSIGNMLATQVGSQLAPTHLRSSMVLVLSADTVILGLNPYLVACDLRTSETSVWSRTRCLEDMQRRNTTLGTLFAKGLDLFGGKLQESPLMDMHPVSALAVADNDPNHIFSLHTDGTVRHWILSPQQPEPWQVSELSIRDIPPNQVWSDADPFALALTARIYQQDRFGLAIHIRTHTTTTEETSLNDEDMMELQDTGCSHLMVVEGPSNELRYEAYEPQCMRLHVPSSAKSLVSMSFDPHNPTRLVALFQAKDHQGMYATWLLSNNSTEPQITRSDFLLDRVAIREVQRSSRLHVADSIINDMTLEEQLTLVDQRYMQYLFRPAFPRGTGLAMPPLAIHVERALHQLTPRPNDNHEIRQSLELTTLLAMHKWRNQTEQTISWAPGTFQQESADEQQQVRQRQVQAHEQRWQEFLQQVWQQEQAERLQLCMGILSDGTIVVVRAGSVSVLQRQQSVPMNVHELDVIAAKALVAMEQQDDGEHTIDSSVTLAAIQAQVWDSVSRGVLGVEENNLEQIKMSLNDFAQSKVLRSLTFEESSRILDIPEPELVALMQDSSISSFFPCLSPCTEDGLSSTSVNRVVLTQQRAAAASLAIRGVDHVRRVLLGRLLVLFALNTNSQATDICLRMYLHCVTVLWTSAQRVDMRFLSTTGSSKSLPALRLDDNSSPTKRASLDVGGSAPSSILAVSGTRDKTTAIDSLMIYLADKLQCESPGSASLLSDITQLASHAVAALLSFFGGTQPPRRQENIQLPELVAIPPLSSTVTDQPKLALRLLGVYMAIPDDRDPEALVSLRNHVFAECLLIASSGQTGKKADAMVEAAMDILSFSPEDTATSLKRVQTMEHHLRDKPMHQERFTQFIMNAIQSTQDIDVVTKLWSTLFAASVASRRWNTALAASMSTPDKDKRKDCLKRLVRAMVDTGSLSELLEMCASLDGSVDQAGLVDSLQNNRGFYGIAVETLAENSGRDLFTLLAVDPKEPLSDYSGALFALHVSQGQWKMAAETLDARYESARKALMDRESGADLGPEAQSRREALIVNDLVLSSLGCVMALKQVPGVSSEFLVRDSGSLPSLPPLRRLDDHVTPPKRGRDAFSTSPAESTLAKAPRFQTLTELSTRAVTNVALQMLFLDKLAVSKDFAISAFTDPAIAKEKFMEVVDNLFASGYFHEGLMVANAHSNLRGSKPEGQDLFSVALELLLREYLVPLALNQLVPTERPTLSQLTSAFESTAAAPERPSVLALGRRDKKIASLYKSAVIAGASALVHRLTLEYTTAENPVALEVAKNVVGQLPSWLHHFLVNGGGGNTSEVGLFARRRMREDSNVYLGDPSALLSLYTKRGMYLEACRLVTLVLSGSNSSEREKNAPFRLPEKGNMDFVPYNKIDLLWNLIENAVNENVLNQSEAAEVLSARKEMEKALEKHFELLKISEMGLTSARALS